MNDRRSIEDERHRLLAGQDARLRHCGWCGQWEYGQRDCTTCGASAQYANDSHHYSHKDTA